MGKQLQILLAVACAFALTPCALAPGRAQDVAKGGAENAGVVEQGKFRLHKFEQPIGEETYEVKRQGESLNVAIDFKFNDRGGIVPLVATFRGSSDLAPQAFAIRGKTSRQTTIDEQVEVQPGRVLLRNREHRTETVPPTHFFTIAGYAPSTMQMLMVRYWATHGRPMELVTLPSGRVKIDPRGEDSISTEGKSERLERYTIEGLIWGRETAWFNAHQDLIAVVTTDAEFDHFEAVREGYESALATFVARAGADEMAALDDLSNRIAGNRSATLALVGGTLVDGTGHAALPDSAVLIRNGRIAAVGPRLKLRIPKNAEVVNARGKTILPGLWDMHAHFEQVEWGPIYLAAGVTTVRDCGNELEFITAVRDAIAGGRGLGPRILAAGIVDGSGPHSIGVARVDTPDQARQWVDRYHNAGFQQMKIYSSLKLEQVKAVAEEAHRLGMTVTGHVPDGLDAYKTIEAGQDQINHIPFVVNIMHAPLPGGASPMDRLKAAADVDLNSPEAQKAITFLKQHRAVVDPTLVIYELFTATTAKPPASFEPGVNKVAPELAAQLISVGPPGPESEVTARAFEKYIAAVRALHRAGISIVAGTDQTVPGYSLYREMELYVQAGFTPLEALQAATIVPARVMGLEKQLGTIEAGKQADLILLDANPLDDIHNIRQVRFVVTSGKLYNCADLWRSVGFKP